jgi:RNA polymerase sigma-70 factor (ECF subfamily)
VEEERSLMERLARREPGAWEVFYDSHAERLWVWVGRLMGGSAADVGDVIQETFLEAARKAGDFDARRGRGRMWLWGIARRQVALHFRKRRHERVRKGAGQEGPAEAAMRGEQAAAVRAALASLPDDYAFVLAAKYFEGMTTAGLGAAMGISEAAAESQLARARSAFRLDYGRASAGRLGVDLAKEVLDGRI